MSCEKNVARIDWVDMARGFGTFLVLLGHLLKDGSYLKIAIYSFHIPLFFFLSGYVFKLHRSIKEEVKKRIGSLLVPYFIYLTISIAYGLLIGQKSTFAQILFIDGQTVWNDPIWFVLAIFAVQIISIVLCSFSWFCNLMQKKWFFSIPAVLFVTVMFFYTMNIKDYFGFEKILLGCAYFFLGIACKKFGTLNNIINNFSAIATTGGGYILLGLLQNNNLSFYQMQLDMYWIYIGRSLCGILLVCCLAFIIKRSRIIIYLGKHSLVIMASQYFLISTWWHFGEFIIDNTLLHTSVAIGLSILVFWIYIPICSFVDQICPILNGSIKMDTKKKNLQ